MSIFLTVRMYTFQICDGRYQSYIFETCIRTVRKTDILIAKISCNFRKGNWSFLYNDKCMNELYDVGNTIFIYIHKIHISI